ncbi:TIGR03619 family F420-dependent LLM class oxidoreductase [Smaragdicoccus niigatensis]|uniref:TIGR03619 family F420-dependent LLM class oxidoreductase n=1 Tax=Smaragdicoccus niigatensis TaxID=359359 RepID=UPI00037BF3C4|nr:TIGR03619 family F420-dependent LLM class oxidoreductase [Smaragdicoccus niigatensis]
MSVHLGVHLPYREPWGELDFAGMVALAEQYEFESAWVPDHTVLAEKTNSLYPFSDTGQFISPPDEDWYDWVVLLSYLAGLTSTIRLGVAVAILAHRHPVTVGKQIATIDRLSGGRVSLGIGAGWLAEEFEALGVPFDERGKRTDAGIALLREVWTGAPAAGDYGPYRIPEGIRSHPTPFQNPVPVLVGGESPAAIRRAVAAGGWFGTSAGGTMSPAHLESVVQRLRAKAEATGKDPDGLDVTLRVAAPGRQVGTAEYTQYLRELVSAGATRLTFDVNWAVAERAEIVLKQLAQLEL